MKSISKYLLISLIVSMASMPTLKGAASVGTTRPLNSEEAEAADLFIRFTRGVPMKWKQKFISPLIDLLRGNPYFPNFCKYLYRMRDETNVDTIVTILQEMFADPEVKKEIPQIIFDEIEKQKSQWRIAKMWESHFKGLITKSLRCK
jgi:hypothetical protein